MPVMRKLKMVNISTFLFLYERRWKVFVSLFAAFELHTLFWKGPFLFLVFLFLDI